MNKYNQNLAKVEDLLKQADTANNTLQSIQDKWDELSENSGTLYQIENLKEEASSCLEECQTTQNELQKIADYLLQTDSDDEGSLYDDIVKKINEIDELHNTYSTLFSFPNENYNK